MYISPFLKHPVGSQIPKKYPAKNGKIFNRYYILSCDSKHRINNFIETKEIIPKGRLFMNKKIGAKIGKN